MSLNIVAISGNITRDPELRTTPGGTSVLNFGVAVNDRRQNPQTGEWEDYPNFIDLAVFGKRAAAIAPYLHKGTKVSVQGRLRYHSWERDGQKRSKVEVVVDEIEFMAPRQDAAPQAPAYRQPAPQPYPQQAYPQPQQPAPQWTAQQAYQQPPATTQPAPVPQPAPAPRPPQQAPQQAHQLVQPPEVYDEDIPF